MSLSNADRTRLQGLLGTTASIVASTVAQLHLSSPDPRANPRDPDSVLRTFPQLSEQEWKNTNVVGALVFVIDRAIDTFVFQIYDLVTDELRFEYELYYDIVYAELGKQFHSFEMEDCVAGFCFADAGEAQNFFSKVKALRPSSKSTDPVNIMRAGKQMPASRAKSVKKKGGMFGWLGGGSKKGGRNSTRSPDIQIGPVMRVVHNAHVGVNAAGEFDLDNLSPEWKNLFRRAGVKKKDLEDPEQAAAIFAVVAEQQAVVAEQQAVKELEAELPAYTAYKTEELEQYYTEEQLAQYEAYQRELEEYNQALAAYEADQLTLEMSEMGDVAPEVPDKVSDTRSQHSSGKTPPPALPSRSRSKSSSKSKRRSRRRSNKPADLDTVDEPAPLVRKSSRSKRDSGSRSPRKNKETKDTEETKSETKPKRGATKEKKKTEGGGGMGAELALHAKKKKEARARARSESKAKAEADAKIADEETRIEQAAEAKRLLAAEAIAAKKAAKNEVLDRALKEKSDAEALALAVQTERDGLLAEIAKLQATNAKNKQKIAKDKIDRALIPPPPPPMPELIEMPVVAVLKKAAPPVPKKFGKSPPLPGGMPAPPKRPSPPPLPALPKSVQKPKTPQPGSLLAEMVKVKLKKAEAVADRSEPDLTGKKGRTQSRVFLLKIEGGVNLKKAARPVSKKLPELKKMNSNAQESLIDTLMSKLADRRKIFANAIDDDDDDDDGWGDC